jgi:growth arrest-specific protein 8
MLATRINWYLLAVQVYKQKVKHLLFEQQNKFTEVKAESSAALQIERDENRVSEYELRKDKRDLKIELKEQELAHEEMIKNMRKVNILLLTK